ncbi:MAG: leucine-rich repeat domain-containing protein, partial [Candidatus Poribacteria bacterium]|nr:leucine-rich repeat domain-containing protein [Candidatus Poribacteria bacterium]
IDSRAFKLVTHELGHAFGLGHDFREGIASDYLMAYGDSTRLSKCAAEWLSVSPFFTTNPISDNTPGEIRLISTPTYSPEGVRFRFEVADTNGLHQAQLLLPAALGEILSDCKQLEGETSTIEFISTELTIEPVDSVMLQIIDVNGNITWATFSTDITSILPAAQIISIPDANLATAVRTELGLGPNAPITDREIKKLRRLEYPAPDLRDNQKIGDLTGLEAATNLESLNLYANRIRDLSALGGLQKLSTLTLPNNQIEDISPLEGLQKLKRLWLTNNRIENINALKIISQSLELLDLGNNPIEDFRPIVGFVNLTWLDLHSNRFKDTGLEIIAEFTQLERLNLRNNQIRNINSLTKLTNLRWLYIADNEISDVRPLTRLTKLKELHLHGNPIKDREPLLAMLRRNPDIKIYLKAGGDPLPVSLSRFWAELTDVGIVIRWVTESELDNAGFNILRSETKDSEFKVVNPTLIQGAGTTSERQTYTWTDTTAKPNVVYYYQIEDISHAGIREQLATVRMRGYVSAVGKLTTRWGDLKKQE